jgi:hemolysin activation/secretion protein
MKRSKTRAALTLAALLAGPPAVSAQVLPPPPAAKNEIPAEVFVREFQFEGATAFSQAELANALALYTGRTLTADELEDARRAVTLYYVNHGYINSGAILPDQDPSNGVIKIKVVEGEITKIEVHDNKWLTDGYLKSQLRRWSTAPANLNRMKEGLQLLRQNPNITQINAELAPGATPGQSILDVRVQDQQPFRFALDIDNYRPPSVGAEEITLRARIQLRHREQRRGRRLGVFRGRRFGRELHAAHRPAKYDAWRSRQPRQHEHRRGALHTTRHRKRNHQLWRSFAPAFPPDGKS